MKNSQAQAIADAFRASGVRFVFVANVWNVQVYRNRDWQGPVATSFSFETAGTQALLAAQKPEWAA